MEIILNKNGLLKINLNHLGNNYKNLKKILKKSRIGGVLKANAYGLGLNKIARKLLSLGCRDFFLTSLEESLAVRDESKNSNIILLNGIINLNENEIKKMLNFRIIPVINSLLELKKFYKNYNESNEETIALHFDTGINRLGVTEREANEVINFCKKKKTKIFCIMSHLASADEPRNIMNKKQINKFEEIIQNFKESQHSLANSNGIINLKQIEFNIVRSGGCLFGTIENNHFKNIIELYARVLQIKDIECFHEIYGYNGTYQTRGKKRIAIIGFGYADGYPRILSNISYVFLKKRLPVIGSISMDYMTVDISKLKDKDIKVGDYVELIGKNIKLSEIAKKSHTIPYEILNNIGNRVKKIYID